MKQTRQVIFRPAWDNRNAIPKKNQGIGSVRCWLILKGKEGAVHFTFSTGMYLSETHKTWLNTFPYNDEPYMGFDVGYHSPHAQYDGQTPRKEKCEYIGKRCYSDGSALAAEKYMDIFVREGDEAVWKLLEKDYKERFLV